MWLRWFLWLAAQQGRHGELPEEPYQDTASREVTPHLEHQVGPNKHEDGGLVAHDCLSGDAGSMDGPQLMEPLSQRSSGHQVSARCIPGRWDR